MSDFKEYPKINSIFKRDRITNKFILGEWSTPEFACLKNAEWEFTEKFDGTNIRVKWDGATVIFGGRTERASIPAGLLNQLNIEFTPEKLKQAFPEQTPDKSPIIFYGEGIGHKIQGNPYCGHEEYGFILFDVRMGHWWMRREDVEDFALKMTLRTAPIIGYGTIDSAIQMVKNGLQSKYSLPGKVLEAEGLVLRTTAGLLDRRGERIITKIKGRDFK